MTTQNTITQLYNDNLRLTDELYKRDLLIKLLMSRLETKINRRKENGKSFN